MESVINKAIVALLPLIPRSMVWWVSRRYIAGKTLEDALLCVEKLNAQGMSATLDVLGEDTTDHPAALAGEQIYQSALREISGRGLNANISVKLSMLGLKIDPAFCQSILLRLIQSAELYDNYVRMDMEDSSVTAVTLELYRKMRAKSDRIGAVVQAYLRSTEASVAELLSEGVTNLRICKGIYIEPEEIAFTDFYEVQDSFRATLRLLLENGAQRVGIATHDPELVLSSLEVIKELEIPKERYEFQMLLGVAEKMRGDLVADGHPLRVYVPFGEEWYAYSTRRLRENPQIAGHVVKNLFSG
ncbi:MAG: proline dehydrogenase family protein [Planctomycetota bacterium]|nr:proline dehydrogenase family protein [Planctomycetota bacterium]